MTVYIGIDIGKRNCITCIMDADGYILEEGKYPNTLKAAEEFALHAQNEYGECKVVCESTANMWLKTYSVFEKHNIDIVLGNPLRLKLSQSGSKTDKIDARKLANRRRMDDVPTSHVYPPEYRRIKDILKQRVDMVQDRTRVLNRQASILDKYDHHMKTTHSCGPKYQAWLTSRSLENGDLRLMASHSRYIEFLNKEIDTLDFLIAKEAYHNENVKLLMTIPGINAFAGLVIDTAIHDITRFESPKKLVSFMGLCPRVYQSGNSIKHGRMKKDRDGTLTWAMMQAAMTAAKYDPRLKLKYKTVCARHSPMVARSHVANKMAISMWHILTYKEPYRYVNQEMYERKLAKLELRISSRQALDE